MGVLGCIAATYKAKLVGTCAKGKEHHPTSPEDFHMDKDTGLSGLSHLDTARHEACFSTRKNTWRNTRGVPVIGPACRFLCCRNLRQVTCSAESGTRVLCAYAAMNACLELSMRRGQQENQSCQAKPPETLSATLIKLAASPPWFKHGKCAPNRTKRPLTRTVKFHTSRLQENQTQKSKGWQAEKQKARWRMARERSYLGVNWALTLSKLNLRMSEESIRAIEDVAHDEEDKKM